MHVPKGTHATRANKSLYLVVGFYLPDRKPFLVETIDHNIPYDSPLPRKTCFM